MIGTRVGVPTTVQGHKRAGAASVSADKHAASV